MVKMRLVIRARQGIVSFLSSRDGSEMIRYCFSLRFRIGVRSSFRINRAGCVARAIKNRGHSHGIPRVKVPACRESGEIIRCFAHHTAGRLQDLMRHV